MFGDQSVLVLRRSVGLRDCEDWTGACKQASSVTLIPELLTAAASHDLCGANPPCSQSMLFVKLIVRCARAGKVTTSTKRLSSLTDGLCLGVFLVTSVGFVSLTVHKELKTGTRGNLW
jgi:hypothetical protein